MSNLEVVLEQNVKCRIHLSPINWVISDKLDLSLIVPLKGFALQMTPLGKPRGKPQIGGKCYQYMTLTEVLYSAYIV